MLKYEPSNQENISTACKNALTMVEKTGQEVTFQFNGITMVVNPEDVRHKIYVENRYWLARSRCD